MRCKNCGLENDDNLYICQNCGSPLYDEADINDESTVEFKKIGDDNSPEDDNNNDNKEPNKDKKKNKGDKKDEDAKKKQLTITIIVLSVVLVAIIAGIIGAVIANNKNNDDETTSPSSTSAPISSTTKTTTKPSTTKPITEAPVAQYMVTVRANEGGNVDGGGQFEKGKQIKITATPNSGYSFIGWYTPNGVRVSQSLSHTFTLNEDVIFEAKFEKIKVPETTKPTEKETKPEHNQDNTTPSKDVQNG